MVGMTVPLRYKLTADGVGVQGVQISGGQGTVIAVEVIDGGTALIITLEVPAGFAKKIAQPPFEFTTQGDPNA
jgi:hypothetical protein